MKITKEAALGKLLLVVLMCFCLAVCVYLPGVLMGFIYWVANDKSFVLGHAVGGWFGLLTCAMSGYMIAAWVCRCIDYGLED